MKAIDKISLTKVDIWLCFHWKGNYLFLNACSWDVCSWSLQAGMVSILGYTVWFAHRKQRNVWSQTELHVDFRRFGCLHQGYNFSLEIRAAEKRLSQGCFRLLKKKKIMLFLLSLSCDVSMSDFFLYMHRQK